jgi:hypothetical protein
MSLSRGALSLLSAMLSVRPIAFLSPISGGAFHQFLHVFSRCVVDLELLRGLPKLASV